jgi:hypothetical protein
MAEYRRDPELYAQPTTWPGAKLPHTWVTERGRRISTLDLAGHGRFAVVTGIGGGAWLDAAAGLADHFGLTITPVSIGPGQPYEDPYGTWADLREIDDGGVLLVRPDLYIAARHLACPASPEEAREWLARVLSSILGPVPSHGQGAGKRPDMHSVLDALVALRLSFRPISGTSRLQLSVPARAEARAGVPEARPCSRSVVTG